MITTRIDLALLNADESRLLAKLFKACKDRQVFIKDREYKFRCFNTKTKLTELHSVTLSHDIVRRPRNKDAQAIRYEVVENSNKIGEGGFSKVFGILCTLAVDNNQVIVKKNKERVVKIQKYSEYDLQNLIKEVDLTQKAKNMHMKRPAVIKTGKNEYIGYSVMKRLSGTDLYSIITQLYSNALDLTSYQRLTITIKLLTQLKALHEKGIIHRDIKPDNIMLDLNTGELDIYDYGLSKRDTDDNKNEDIMGTLGYIPPESYLNKGTTAKSDIFSMSVVIGMLWYADEPGCEPEDVFNFRFNNIFNDEKIDLNEIEKREIMKILKGMSKNERDDRYTADQALNGFIDIRETYVNRKIDEMAQNKPKLYRLEGGLFVNNKAKKVEAEVTPTLHSCRF